MEVKLDRRQTEDIIEKQREQAIHISRRTTHILQAEGTAFAKAPR